MHFLRDWSFGKVLLLAGGWVGLWMVIAVVWALVTLRGQMASTGSAGIGAVSFSINALILAVVVLPPLALTVVWLIGRVLVRPST